MGESILEEEHEAMLHSEKDYAAPRLEIMGAVTELTLNFGSGEDHDCGFFRFW